MSHTRPGMWTPERVILFDEIHEQAPKIIWAAVNALPGPAVTRGAIMGRRDRKHGLRRRPVRTLEEITAALLARRERDNLRQKERRAAKKPGVNFNRHEAAKERAANGGDPGPYICIEAADIVPRNLTLMELEDGNCRYPYGDGSIVFCGHPQRAGSSYCSGHHQICWAKPKPAASMRPAYVELGRSSGGIFGRAG